MNEVKEIIDMKKASCREMNVKELMQLLKMNVSIFWSWGVHNIRIDSVKNGYTKAFRMNVSGHHHKGHVYIFLSYMDLFDVYLTSTQGMIKQKIEGLYFDQLVDWIDEKIEKIPEYSR